MNESQSRLEAASFGRLLKSWRSKSKLSQLDLALGCEVSQRHVSFLESGRAKPSQRMVLQLSEALHVPLRDRNALLRAAGFAPLYCQRELGDEAMAPIRDALTRMLDHHAPYPAVVVDREYNLLMENRAFGSLLGLFGDPAALWRACCPSGKPNLFRLTFHPQGARPLIRNFEEIAPLLLQRAWHETLASGGPLHDFICQLRQDPTLPAHWHVPDPGALSPPVLSLVIGQDDMEFKLFTMISTFGTPHDVTTDEIRVETFFPADTATEQLLRRLDGA